MMDSESPTTTDDWIGFIREHGLQAALTLRTREGETPYPEPAGLDCDCEVCSADDPYTRYARAFNDWQAGREPDSPERDFMAEAMAELDREFPEDLD